MVKLWTTKQLADAAGVDPSYVRRLIEQGVIKANKLANTWFIQDPEARRWLDERKDKK